MFYRRWRWFGPLKSDEGFSLTYQHRTVVYQDGDLWLTFAFEDGYLFTEAAFPPEIFNALPGQERDRVVERVVAGLKWDGLEVEVFNADRDSNVTGKA